MLIHLLDKFLAPGHLMDVQADIHRERMFSLALVLHPTWTAVSLYCKEQVGQQYDKPVILVYPDVLSWDH